MNIRDRVEEAIKGVGHEGHLCLWCDETFEAKSPTECPHCQSGDLIREIGSWGME